MRRHFAGWRPLHPSSEVVRVDAAGDAAAVEFVKRRAMTSLQPGLLLQIAFDHEDRGTINRAAVTTRPTQKIEDVVARYDAFISEAPN